ncbi:hypothetical protein vBBak6_091 [Bacillus phage v_B-Bak6]|nr:hypothetical protein vBBak1_091 [Bacillus phage v_B-Bak1]AXY83171.1 hypothetical protein vBBak6_091 [Bacillus phage v_B-Bak6]
MKKMIIKINGVAQIPSVGLKQRMKLEKYVEPEVLVKKRKVDLKKIATTLWTASGVFFAKHAAFAAANGAQKINLWEQLFPVFDIFQQLGMVFGAFALIAGLSVMFVKKRVGMGIIMTSAVVIAGVFLVPSAVMLIAIIGSMLNDTLVDVFNGLNVKGSVRIK